MKFTDTIPEWKMPDEERIPHHNRVIIRMWAKLSMNDICWLLDLTEYYDWAEDNGIDMEHNMLRIGEDKCKSAVMFTFWNDTDAMAFKLRWSL